MRGIWAERGDTFFTRSESVLGRLIRYGETDPGEDAPWTNHCGVVVESGWILPPDANGSHQPAVVVEALWHTRRGPLKLNGNAVRVFRPVPEYTEEEIGRFVAEAETYVGARYGWWKLVFQLGDRVIFRGRKVLTHLLFIKTRPICSFLAAWVNFDARTSPGFGMDPETADPDSMMDFCLAHPEFWWEPGAEEVAVNREGLAKAA
jgi:hypothetical protein